MSTIGIQIPRPRTSPQPRPSLTSSVSSTAYQRRILMATSVGYEPDSEKQFPLYEEIAGALSDASYKVFLPHRDTKGSYDQYPPGIDGKDLSVLAQLPDSNLLVADFGFPSIIVGSWIQGAVGFCLPCIGFYRRGEKPEPLVLGVPFGRKRVVEVTHDGQGIEEIVKAARELLDRR